MQANSKLIYSFNLPLHLGENFVEVETNHGEIDKISFFSYSGKHLLFSILYTKITNQLINPLTLAYIESVIYDAENFAGND